MGFEQPRNKTLEEQEQIISRATNFNELYQLLNETGDIKGSQKVYRVDELKVLIKDFFDGKIGFKEITRAAGLRQKVLELAKTIEV